MKPGDIFAHGKYTLLRKLRSSGMAEVWLARQHGTEGFAKDVVIKRILPHLAEDDKLITMFLDEARIAANLNHPNVVQIFDLGSDGSDYFIAMEYIRGHDLEQIQEHLKKRRIPFPIEYAIRMVADTCLGLSYAHDCTTADGTPMNVVHRDVSPQNVLVSETGVVKLIDFGIAKARTSSTRTQVGHTKGKICYMSPEQMMARELDRRSDIFSAGVVLYEALVGVKPFDGDNLLACFHKLMKEGITYPRQIRGDLSPELEQIIMKALAKDREERYPTATALRYDLEKYLRHEGISVGPEHLADFLKWLFTPPESTQVVLDLPRVKPVQPLKPSKSLSSPSVPGSGRGRFGTEDRVPAVANKRVTSPSSPYANQGGFAEGTVMEEPTVLEEQEPTVLDPKQTTGHRHTGPSLRSHTGPSFGPMGGTGHDFAPTHATGPSLEGPSLGLAMDFSEDDHRPYSHRRKKSGGGGKAWIVVMAFFVLAAGGLIFAQFAGLLPGSRKSNAKVPPGPPRIKAVAKAPTPDAGAAKQPTKKVVKPPAKRPRKRPKVRKVVKRTKPRRRRTKPRRRKRRRRGYGYLIIDTDIRASVTINGDLDYIRVPMLQKRRVRAGRVRLRFIWPPNRSKTKTVYVSPGRTKDIYVRLR